MTNNRFYYSPYFPLIVGVLMALICWVADEETVVTSSTSGAHYWLSGLTQASSYYAFLLLLY
jgi:hypothetical protein